MTGRKNYNAYLKIVIASLLLLSALFIFVDRDKPTRTIVYTLAGGGRFPIFLYGIDLVSGNITVKKEVVPEFSKYVVQQVGRLGNDLIFSLTPGVGLIEDFDKLLLVDSANLKVQEITISSTALRHPFFITVPGTQIVYLDEYNDRRHMTTAYDVDNRRMGTKLATFPIDLTPLAQFVNNGILYKGFGSAEFPIYVIDLKHYKVLNKILIPNIEGDVAQLVSSPDNKLLLVLSSVIKVDKRDGVYQQLFAVDVESGFVLNSQEFDFRVRSIDAARGYLISTDREKIIIRKLDGLETITEISFPFKQDDSSIIFGEETDGSLPFSLISEEGSYVGILDLKKLNLSSIVKVGELKRFGNIGKPQVMDGKIFVSLSGSGTIYEPSEGYVGIIDMATNEVKMLTVEYGPPEGFVVFNN